jgi:hypothetical protein
VTGSWMYKVSINPITQSKTRLYVKRTPTRNNT